MTKCEKSDCQWHVPIHICKFARLCVSLHAYFAESSSVNVFLCVSQALVALVTELVNLHSLA